METIKTEMRKDRRHRMSIPCKISIGNSLFENFTTSNISIGGMFIKSKTPPSLKTDISFTLLDKDNNPAFKGKGIVIWATLVRNGDKYGIVSGFGIQFTTLEQLSTFDFYQFIKYYGE